MSCYATHIHRIIHLSPEVAKSWGLPKKSYQRAFDELKEKGFIVREKDNDVDLRFIQDPRYSNYMKHLSEKKNLGCQNDTGGCQNDTGGCQNDTGGCQNDSTKITYNTLENIKTTSDAPEKTRVIPAKATPRGQTIEEKQATIDAIMSLLDED